MIESRQHIFWSTNATRSLENRGREWGGGVCKTIFQICKFELFQFRGGRDGNALRHPRTWLRVSGRSIISNRLFGFWRSCLNFRLKIVKSRHFLPLCFKNYHWSPRITSKLMKQCLKDLISFNSSRLLQAIPPLIQSIGLMYRWIIVSTQTKSAFKYAIDKFTDGCRTITHGWCIKRKQKLTAIWLPCHGR